MRTIISKNATIAINIYGAITWICNNIAQINGPKIKALQNIEPKIHIFVIFSFLVFDISFIIACKILIFHQVIQFIILQNKKNKYVVEKTIVIDDKKVQITQKINIFLLPKISDNCHRIGVAKKAASAYTVIQ